MSCNGALERDLDAEDPKAAKAVKAAAAEKIQADGIKAKLAAGEAAPEKPKKAGKKDAPAAKEEAKDAPAAKEEAKEPAAKKEEVKAPAAAALVGGMPDATFYDNVKCKHTYISPRKVEDFGLDMDADCPEGKDE